MTGDIEKYGSGFIRIRDAVKKYPTMRFLHKSTTQGFTSEFSYEKQKMVGQARNSKKRENVTENVTENRKALIITLMHENVEISTKEIANKLNVTRRTIARDIDALKLNGIIERIGPDKGGYWKIVVK